MNVQTSALKSACVLTAAILSAGVLVLTVAATAAQAGKLESAAIDATRDSVYIGTGSAPAATRHIDVPSIGRPLRTEEVIVSLPSNLSPETIDALARHHQLMHMESKSVGLLGKTLHRWRIADGRSIPDVILALEREGGIDAQPNNIYTLQ